MAGRPDVRAARLGDGDAERVVDPAPRDVLVAGEAGEDRQACGVGGRPAGGAKAVRAEAPDRARAGRPATALAAEGEELVEPAGVAVDEDRVRGREPPSIRTFAGIGYGPRSLSSAYSKPTRERGVARLTTVTGIPIGLPSQSPEPKSAWTWSSSPIERTIASESAATGSRSTRWFQGCPRERPGRRARRAGGWPRLRRRRARPGRPPRGRERRRASVGVSAAEPGGWITPPTRRTARAPRAGSAAARREREAPGPPRCCRPGRRSRRTCRRRARRRPSARSPRRRGRAARGGRPRRPRRRAAAPSANAGSIARCGGRSPKTIEQPDPSGVSCTTCMCSFWVSWSRWKPTLSR